MIEPMGDSRRRRVWDRSVREFGTRQRGVRIDLKGDGNQSQHQDDEHGFHARNPPARMRQNLQNTLAKDRSFVSFEDIRAAPAQPPSFREVALSNVNRDTVGLGSVFRGDENASNSGGNLALHVFRSRKRANDRAMPADPKCR
jgi:hypothetical protein